jgi:RNA polymerase sigma factor (sigma-70 family)
MTSTQEQTQGQRNIELVRRYQSGDHHALNDLTSENDGLVVNIVNKLAMRLDISPFDPLVRDFEQEGRIALLDSARLFDPNAGIEFSSYAGRSIASRVNRWASQHIGCVYVPAYVAEKESTSKHVKKAHFCRGGRDEDFWDWMQQAIGASPIESLEEREEREHQLKQVNAAIPRLPKVRQMAVLERLGRESISHDKSNKCLSESYLKAVKQLRSIIRKDAIHGRSCAMES